MSLSYLKTYIIGTISLIPWGHWAIMDGIALALTVFLLVRKKCSVYGAIVLGITVFLGAVSAGYSGVNPLLWDNAA